MLTLDIRSDLDGLHSIYNLPREIISTRRIKVSRFVQYLVVEGAFPFVAPRSSRPFRLTIVRHRVTWRISWVRPLGR